MRSCMRDKRERFIRLAEKRVNNVLKQIELVGNLGNRANYDYSEEDCQKIFKVIDEEVRKMKRRFAESEHNSKAKFKLTK